MSSEIDACERPVTDETVLSFEQVTFGYTRTPVLREVSFQVREREFIALVGANGAGKTTLLRIALGLLRPSHGTVRLFGERIETFDRWGLVGYVPQRAAGSMVLPVSVEEAVRSGLAGHLGLFRRPTALHRERMEHVMDLMGVASLRREPVGELSGGQLQRTLIARALVTQPRLLVLDEPTTGVDADARRILREAIEHLVDVEGVGVIYISHDPGGFEGLADQVIEIRAGRPHLLSDHVRPPEHPGQLPAPERDRGGRAWKR